MKIKELFKPPRTNNNVSKIGDNEDNKKSIGTPLKGYSKAYPLEDYEASGFNNINLKEGYFNDLDYMNSNSNKNKDFKLHELGANTFRTTLFKDELRTPHFEMQKALEMYEDMPNINAGVNQIVLFITGNEVKITSKDEYTNKWFEKWLEQRTHITETVKNIILQTEVCGNAWVEPVWGEVNGNKYLNNFKLIPDPTRVYYNLSQNADLENEFWVFQVPYIFRKFGEMEIKNFKITYIKNGIAWQEMVYGIGLKKKDLIHIKTGNSRYGYYGRSYLASAINDGEIVNQILKNYAIASRYMAFGKKLVSIGDENDMISTDELQKFNEILNSLEDEEHIAINKKATIQDINPSQFNEMQGGLNFVRKDMSAGLLPNFMTPWADTMGSYSSTNNAKIPFELSLENKRNSYIKILNDLILKEVIKQNPRLKSDVTFEFGEVTLDNSRDTQTTLLELYNNDVITLNQLLKGLNLETLEHGDIYKTTRNYIYQKKYTMNQADIENLEEPFLQRKIYRDYRDFSNSAGSNVNAGLNEGFNGVFKQGLNFTEKKEIVNALKAIEKDEDFLKKYKIIDPDVKEIIKTQQVEDSNILRLCKDENGYFIIDNLKKISDYYYDLEIVKKMFDQKIEEVKLEYKNYFVGATNEDEITNELFKYVKELQWEATKNILDELKKDSTNKESFKGPIFFKEKNVLNKTFLSRIDGLFGMFDNKLKNKINELLGVLVNKEIKVIDDMQGREDNNEAKKNIEEINENKELLSDLIFNQFQTFNQNQSQEIKRILTTGVLNNNSISQIQQELKDGVLDWKKYKPSDADYRILRIANTEVHRAGLQLKLLNWKNLGVEYVKYIAVQDDKTRPEHIRLHNRIFSIDEALNLEEWKEINCRCTFIPWSI